MIAIGLSKQQALDANPKATQEINFTANLDRAGEAKEIVFKFSQGTIKFF